MENARQLRRNGIIIFSIYFSIGVYLLLAYLYSPDSGLVLAELGFLFFLCAIPIVLWRFECDIFSLLFLVLLTILITYSLKPIYLILHEGIVMNDKGIIIAMAYLLLFTALLILGYFLKTGKLIARRLPELPGNWSYKSVKSVIPMFMILGIMGWLFLLKTIGTNITSFYSETFFVRYKIFETAGMFHFRNLTLWFLWSAFWVPLIYYFVHRRYVHGKYLMVLYILFLLIISFGFGQRLVIVAPIFSIFALTNLNKKTGILKILGLIGSVIAFSYIYQTYRSLSWTGVTFGRLFDSLSDLSDLSFFDFIFKVGIGGQIMLELLAKLVSSYPIYGADYLYGSSYLYVLTSLLPRSLFPWRPQYTDSYLTDLFFHTGLEDRGGGVAWGVISELYINFHIFGIVIGAVLLGIFLRTMQTYVEINKNNPGVRLCYVNGYINILTYGIPLVGIYSNNTVELLFFLILNIILTYILSGVMK